MFLFIEDGHGIKPTLISIYRHAHNGDREFHTNFPHLLREYIQIKTWYTLSPYFAANGVLVGPWGGKGGVNPWIFIPSGRICEIRISTSGCVDSIRFTYIDHQGVQKHSERYGGDGGSAQTVTFIDDEHFIGITGTVGVYEGYTVITSLSFLTNKKNYGPYGTNKGTSFSLPITKDSFVGLTGNYGAYIDSFSVILQSSSVGNIFSTNMASNKIYVGPWGGKGGVKPWTFIPNGRISQICISASGCVDSIRFTYIDHQGVQKQSERYGGDGGSAHTLTLVDDEHFIGITGTVGVYERYTMITSLCFLTNRKNYGPYGTNQGTSFSLPVAMGSFGGFSGNYGAYMDSFSVILQSTSLENIFSSNTASNRIHVGPWGGNGGVKPWTFIPNGRIFQIRISTFGCVDSIRFTYIDHQGVQKHSERYGGDGGSVHTVTFVDDEHLIGITGTVGIYERYTVITSLSFLTNKKNYGPYGTNQGTSFSLPVAKGSFSGFGGNYGAYIDSFSVILQSSSLGKIFNTNIASNGIHVGPWGGNGGVKPWTFIPNGRISQIRINASGCVDSIRFTYIDHQGVQKQSKRYGGYGGSAHTVTFVDDEHFIGIIGTVGVYEGYTVIRSMSFLTNKNNYGPYGTNQGTSFSLPVAKGSFSGFSGNYGAYIDSLSVILQPSSFGNIFTSNMENNRIHVGPWGGNGGVKPWTFIPNGRISQIHISASGCVDSIRFTYIDHQGVQKHSERYGGDGGSAHMVTFVDDEHLIGITGNVGVYEGYTVIRSMSFHTNKKNYGPYGTNQGTSFSLPVAKGSFGGFSGNYGAYIDSFSVILQSSSFGSIITSNVESNRIHVGQWGGNGGVKPWTFIPNGRISQIRVSASGCVDSIRFTYIDNQGVQKYSERYGGDGGSAHIVTFVDDEHFIGITGTVGVYEGYTVIRSISFLTNKNNYGPYGTNQGTSFSLPVAKGSISGFSGNYGAYIDSLSVILQSSSFGNIFTTNMVTFVDDEHLIGITGTVGVYEGYTVIRSMSFLTNKKNYGPYGTNQGTSFSLPVAKGSFGGFSGNYGAYIDSFSVILQSSSFGSIITSNVESNIIHVGPWGGNGGVKPWTFIPNGRISQIRVSASGCVDSIRFTYIDNQGVQKYSERYGGDGGSAHIVTFVDDEQFIGITGTVGVYEGYTVIRSISFLTNKNNYGPYGTNQGTSFSLPVAKGSFSGFSGNYGAYIDSLSVILQSSSFGNIFTSNMESNGIHVGPWRGNAGLKP
uniref:Jacalin-type lectin domain-containing protein n=1 Tax=Lactuca sativa TaxID=4236 RepID=A0A9R1XDK4_LACSA|nr:hypothetical protein LSAT_V11C400207350 [Lactuca sativa]